MDRLEAHRMFFAQLVTASVGVPATERNLIEAFASTPRERFLGDARIADSRRQYQEGKYKTLEDLS